MVGLLTTVWASADVPNGTIQLGTTSSYIEKSEDGTTATVHLYAAGDLGSNIDGVDKTALQGITTLAVVEENGAVTNNADIQKLSSSNFCYPQTIDLSGVTGWGNFYSLPTFSDESNKQEKVVTLILPNNVDYTKFKGNNSIAAVVYKMGSGSSTTTLVIASPWYGDLTSEVVFDIASGDDIIITDEMKSVLGYSESNSTIGGNFVIKGTPSKDAVETIIEACGSSIESLDLSSCSCSSCSDIVDVICSFSSSLTQLESIQLPADMTLEQKKQLQTAMTTAGISAAKDIVDIVVSPMTVNSGEYTITVNMGLLGYIDKTATNYYVLNLTSEQKEALKGATSITVKYTDKMTCEEMSVLFKALSSELGENSTSAVTNLDLSGISMADEVAICDDLYGNSNSTLTFNKFGVSLASLKTVSMPVFSDGKIASPNNKYTTYFSLWCKNAEQITFAEGTKSIGANSFDQCTSLTTVNLPAESELVIGEQAFNGCTKLANVNFAGVISKVSANAFSGCSALKDITIKAKTIDDKAFLGTCLESVVLEGTTEIGESAFSNCIYLASVIFSKEMKKIGEKAFAQGSGSANLTVIFNDGLEEIGLGAFQFANILQTKVRKYNDDGTTEDIDYGLHTIVLGSSLKCIETNAFLVADESITDVYVLATTAPKCYANAFNGILLSGNNGFDGTNNVVCREKYKNGDAYLTILHFPKECSEKEAKHYTDLTKHYALMDETQAVDGNGKVRYWPSHPQFARIFSQANSGYLWDAWLNNESDGSESNIDGWPSTYSI